MAKLTDIKIDTPVEVLNDINKGTLMENLGIKYTLVEEGYVEGEMPIDNRTLQPNGILHGGASLALAETLAGMGSYVLVDNMKYSLVGTNSMASHIAMGKGNKVKGVAKIVHQGRRTHVWNIDIFREDGKLISTIRFTNQIIENLG